MADRYFIGTGARNWNDTANWSDTDGGSSGVSVPTSADNVFFTSNSGTGTITVNANAACADLTLSNLAGGLTLSSSVYTFSVYGNLTLPATNLTWTFTGTSYLYLKATTSVNITMGATTGRSFNRLYFDGVGGTWTLQDEMNVGVSLLFPVNGTITTNNNTLRYGYLYTQVGTKTLNLGSSLIYGGFVLQNTTTLNAGTSTIYCDVFYSFGSQTYYNVVFTGSYSMFGGVTNTIFNNLTINGLGVVTANIALTMNPTINGTLTIAGNNSTNYRLLVASSSIGTPRTITCNGTIVASNVDFRDITLAGTVNRVSAITGGSGDCGGNSGITFTPAVPQYYKHTGGGTTLWSDATKWFSDAALTVQGRVPLPQDDSNFIAGSFSQACTLSVNCPRIGRSLDMSAVNQAVTFTLANAIECYGSYVLGNNIITSGQYSLTLMQRGNCSINTYNKNIHILNIRLVGFKCTLLSDFTGLFGVITYSSTIDFNDFNCTCESLSLNSSICYLGNGIITLKNGSYGTFSCYAGDTVYAEGSTLKLNASSGSSNIPFVGGGKTFNIIQLSNGGTFTGNYDFTGSNTIAELIIDAGRKVRFTSGTTQTIAKLTAIGTAIAPITIDSITAATHTINYTGAATQCEYLSIKNSIVTQSNTLYAANSTDLGGNLRWVLGSMVTILNIIANFTESETLTGITNAIATIQAAFEESKTISGEVIAKAFIEALLTEEETMLWVRKIIERITGNVILTDTITGNVNFVSSITGNVKFKSKVSGNVKFIENYGN